MTEQAERDDRIGEGYERWWAPVLAPSAVALLDRLSSVVGAVAGDVLDVGTGTGTLALAAIARWPDARVTGIDASSEMLEEAERLADMRLTSEDRSRLATRTAFAAELPFEDSTFDLAVSSFVLQLVPDRPAALREIRRVLRPTGSLAYVTWLADRSSFEPDRVFDALLDEYGFEDEVGDDREGDLPSPEAAVEELRDAGYRDPTAVAARLEHTFTADSYLRFLTEFDEVSLFEEMARTERRRFLAELRTRLMALTPDALTFRAPIVYATGRPGDDARGD